MLKPHMSQASFEWLESLLGPAQWYMSLYPKRQWDSHDIAWRNESSQ